MPFRTNRLIRGGLSIDATSFPRRGRGKERNGGGERGQERTRVKR